TSGAPCHGGLGDVGASCHAPPQHSRSSPTEEAQHLTRRPPRPRPRRHASACARCAARWICCSEDRRRRYFFLPPMAERSERSERVSLITTLPPFLTFPTFLTHNPPIKPPG